MGSSDSETESECFESAEESFDEESNEKVILNKNEGKSGKEVSNIVSDSPVVDSVPTVERDTSSSSLSYRKRPERVKRFPSRTQTKSKSPTNELVFKTDKIVPDVFLQDITSNFSKNLNKSLNTLQQKSSNVKDLILNSLPVSSTDENEGFCYDDKSIVDDDSKKLEPEITHADNHQSVESPQNVNIKNDKEITKDEIQNESDLPTISGESGNDIEKKSEENINLKDKTFRNDPEKRLDISAESSCTEALSIAPNKMKKMEENITTDNLKDETLSNDSEKSSEIPAESSCTDAVNIVPIKREEITQDININQDNFETLTLAEEESNKDINTSTLVDFTEETDQEIAVCEKIENVLEINPEVKDKEAIKVLDILEPVKSNLCENNPSLAICDENNFSCVIEDKNEVAAECNLEELKTALKNIVKEENIHTEQNSELEGSKDVDENAADGWDDFDFSDDENLNMSDSTQGKKLEDVKTNDKLAKSKSPVAEVRSCNTTDTKNLKEKSTPPKNQANSIVKKTKKVETVSETNIVENDSWDWDAWDDNPEEEVAQTKKPEIKKEKDVSEWSGWDTFGQKPQEKQDSWGLGSWGVDALLNKATAVTQGISSVLEAGLGAPDPETLARMEKLARENSVETVKNIEEDSPSEISKKNSLTNVNLFPVSGITSLVAGVTSKIVEHSKIQEIGTKVITGGLETLETFGKKTMEVLQEGDPGLKNKRALLLGNNKPVLSQVLREAREKAERESKKVEEKELAKKCHFETLFDDFQGMVHLEALEMLSRQCELKLEQIRSGMNPEEQEDLNGILEEVEQLCSLDDVDMKSSMLDFKTVLQMAVEPLKNEISIQNIVQIQEDVNKWLQTSSEKELSMTVINQKLVSTLAELTAATVHQFHKSGELLSVKECRKTVEEVDALSRLTNALCMEINKLGEKFIKLSSNTSLKGDDGNSLNEKVNDVMKNSVFYIKQAFDLLIPVIQLGAAV